MPRLLLVSTYFAPGSEIGGRRIERMARQLLRLGWQVSVLTLRPDYSEYIDPLRSRPEGIEVIETHACIPRSWLRWVRQRLVAGDTIASSRQVATSTLKRSRWRTLLGQAYGWTEFPDPWIGWLPFAVIAVSGRQFDVVLASNPPGTPLLVGAAVAKRTGAKLVLDYRDPWMHQLVTNPALASRRRTLPLHRKVEDNCIGQAHLLTCATRTLMRMLAERTDVAKMLLPNAIDGEIKAWSAASRRDIVYAGSLAYGRSLRPLIDAMALAPADTPVGSLRLHYAGPSGASVERDAGEAGIAGRVVNHGVVDHIEARNMVESAKAAVVVGSNGWEYAIPGKVFEILASATPILVLAPGSSEVLAMAREFRLGWGHEPEDVEGIARSLEAIASNEAHFDFERVELTARYQMKRLDEALRSLI